MLYISLIGNQPMAVINPLLAIAEQAEPPDAIHLLGTARATAGFNHALEFLNQRFGDGIIHLHEVSTDLESRHTVPVVQKVVRELTSSYGGTIVYNLAGGMNFQNAACVQAIGDTPCLFTYPEFDSIHVYAFGPKGFSHQVTPLPNPVDVMSIQAIPCTSGKKTENVRLLMDAAAAVKLKSLPKNCLFNVNFGGIAFDLVWNSGNTMNFLKRVTHSLKFRDMQNAAMLDRIKTGQLYHREIHFLTQDTNLVERASLESLGKVNVLQYRNEKSTGKPDLVSLGTALLKAFMPYRRSAEPALLDACEKMNSPGRGDSDATLVTFLGTHPAATLKSIWSRRPATLWMLYTAGNEQVERLKASFDRHCHLLPVNRVVFQKVDFTGASLLRIPGPSCTRLEVNVTPGTKSQTFFLTRWAMKNDADIFSLDNRDATVRTTPPGKVLPQRLPAPTDFLRLKGEAIKSAWGGREKLLGMEATLEGLIRFIALICEEGGKIEQFPNAGPGRIEADGAVFYRQANNRGRIEFTGEPRAVVFSLSNNIWLEQLMGYMLLKCGAADVAVSTKVQWSAETQARLEKKKQAFVHKNDYDVLAVMDGEYVMVECKSGDDKPVKEMIAQSGGLARTLDRFTLPMLCRFNYHGQPKAENGVWVFGHCTLTDKAALKALIDEAFAGRRTTLSTGGFQN